MSKKKCSVCKTNRASIDVSGARVVSSRSASEPYHVPRRLCLPCYHQEWRKAGEHGYELVCFQVNKSRPAVARQPQPAECVPA